MCLNYIVEVGGGGGVTGVPLSSYTGNSKTSPVTPHFLWNCTQHVYIPFLFAKFKKFYQRGSQPP